MGMGTFLHGKETDDPVADVRTKSKADQLKKRSKRIMSKTLVAYFSASGTTAKAAQELAAAVEGDLYEIRPAIPYTVKDLNWQDERSRSSLEMKDPAARPELADKAAGVASYERIFLGFPIWWYTAPRIIQSFLESYDFSGKTIILFATSGGSGLGKTAKALAGSCPGAAIKEGRMLNGRISPEMLKQWAGKL